MRRRPGRRRCRRRDAAPARPAAGRPPPRAGRPIPRRTAARARGPGAAVSNVVPVPGLSGTNAAGYPPAASRAAASSSGRTAGRSPTSAATPSAGPVRAGRGRTVAQGAVEAGAASVRDRRRRPGGRRRQRRGRPGRPRAPRRGCRHGSRHQILEQFDRGRSRRAGSSRWAASAAARAPSISLRRPGGDVDEVRPRKRGIAGHPEGLFEADQASERPAGKSAHCLHANATAVEGLADCTPTCDREEGRHRCRRPNCVGPATGNGWGRRGGS